MELHHSGGIPHASQCCQRKNCGKFSGGSTIYYSLQTILLFFGLALLFPGFRNLSAMRQTPEVRMHTILTFIALFLFFILCCTDQITAITIFALPILAGLFLERVLDRKTPLLHQKNTRVLLLLLSLGIAIIAGMKLGNLWANGVVGAYADNYSNWTAQETGRSTFCKNCPWHESLLFVVSDVLAPT